MQQVADNPIENALTLSRDIGRQVLLCVAIVGVTILFYVFLDDGLIGFLCYCFWFGVAFGFASLWERYTAPPKNFVEVTCYSYLLLSLLGLLAASIYQASYGLHFSPHQDDTIYFLNALDFTFNRLREIGLERLTPFEQLIAFSMAAMEYVGLGSPELIYLLPINWALGALIVSLAGQLACILSHTRTIDLKILLLLLVGDSIFAWSVIHLYRDAFVIFTFLIGAVTFLQRKYVVWFVAGVLCFDTRGVNALLMLLFNGLSLFSVGKMRHMKRKASVAARIMVASCVVLAIGFILQVYADDMISLISPWYRGAFLPTFQELLKRRYELMLSTGLDNLLYRTWYLVPFAPLMYVFRNAIPARVVSEGVESAFAGGYALAGIEFVDPQTLMVTLFGPIIIGFTMPMLMIAFYRALKSRFFGDFAMLLFFWVTAFLLAFISMQQRHKLVFLVTYPFFYTLFSGNPMTHRERIFFKTLQICLVTAWSFSLVILYLVKN